MHHPSTGPSRVCVLASGGLDSCILLHEMTRRCDSVYPVYVRCGLIWEETEVDHLKRFIAAVHSPKILPLTEWSLPSNDLYREHWSVTGVDVPDGHSADDAVYLPGRNILLLAKAGIFCSQNNVHAIALAVLGTNPFPDATPVFFEMIQEVLSSGLAHPIKVLRPFGCMKKVDVMQLGRSLPLELTFSCVNPQGGVHCGNCNKCEERIQAFRSAGLNDNTVYAHETS